jgi:hypothetical protein
MEDRHYECTLDGYDGVKWFLHTSVRGQEGDRPLIAFLLGRVGDEDKLEKTLGNLDAEGLRDLLKVSECGVVVLTMLNAGLGGPTPWYSSRPYLPQRGSCSCLLDGLV